MSVPASPAGLTTYKTIFSLLSSSLSHCPGSVLLFLIPMIHCRTLLVRVSCTFLHLIKKVIFFGTTKVSQRQIGIIQFSFVLCSYVLCIIIQINTFFIQLQFINLHMCYNLGNRTVCIHLPRLTYRHIYWTKPRPDLVTSNPRIANLI